jgi:hypothetical protein
MKPAGNVGKVDMGHDSGVVAEMPVAITFTHVAIQTNHDLFFDYGGKVLLMAQD